VLQFAPWDSARFDDLIALEEKLIDAVGTRATVDGHDAGSGEANIFVLTDHPAEVLRDCLPVVQHSAFPIFAAGYRSLDADSYQRVWPRGDRSPFTVK
jgi:hypothetical protein